MVRTMETYGPIDERCSGVSGLDGSHGRSHDAFRTLISRHARASETRTGRSATGASSKSGSVRVAGHPWMRPTALIIPLRGTLCHAIRVGATLGGTGDPAGAGVRVVGRM